MKLTARVVRTYAFDGVSTRCASGRVVLDSGFAVWGATLTRRGSAVVHVSLDRRQHPYRGTIALRHETNDFTMRLGHIGYGIRPSARRQVWLSC